MMPTKQKAKTLLKSRSRWTRRVLTLSVFTAVFALFHRPILTEFARALVASNDLQLDDHILIWSGDQCYDVAAELFHRNPDRRILMVNSYPNRLEQMGLVDSERSRFHKELTNRSVPDASQVAIDGVARDDWESGELLSRWLKENPQVTVAILSDEFQSAQLMTKLRRVLGSEAKRITIYALKDRRFNSSNWWKSHPGRRACALSWISRIDSYVRGVPEKRLNKAWDPEEYERELNDSVNNLGTTPNREKPIGWLPSLAGWLDIGQAPKKVNHVLVLPGDQTTRPFVAAALVNAGLADDILVPQNFPSPQETDGIAEPTHEIIRKTLKVRGIPDHKIIILPGYSDRTVDDARVAADFLQANPDDRVAVVTSFYHLRRTRLTFRHVFGNEFDRFDFVAAPADEFNSEDWWKTQAGTFLITAEFLKLGLYWLQYGTGLYWCCAGLLFLAITAGATWRLFRKKASSLSVKAT